MGAAKSAAGPLPARGDSSGRQALWNPAGRSRAAGAVDDLEQVLQVVARGFLAGERAEEDGQLGDELVVLEDVIRYAPGIDGGIVEEFEPIPADSRGEFNASVTLELRFPNGALAHHGRAAFRLGSAHRESAPI